MWWVFSWYHRGSFLTSLTAIATSHPTITLQYFPLTQPSFVCLKPHFPNWSQPHFVVHFFFLFLHGNSLNLPLLFTYVATPSFSTVRCRLLILTYSELPLLFPLSLARLCWTIGLRRESQLMMGFWRALSMCPI